MEAVNPALPGPATPPGEQTVGPAVPAPPEAKKRRLRLPRPVYTLGRLLILALLLEYLVVPQLAGPRKVFSLINRVNPLLLLAALALEVGALLSYGRLTRAVLPPTSKVGFFTIFR
ncbi:MAG: hypothetical protein KGQ66_11185, partial [Acidobacteriota bacterium]|nr:hypothetical protein [Acidobacteriota bacterium]